MGTLAVEHSHGPGLLPLPLKRYPKGRAEGTGEDRLPGFPSAGGPGACFFSLSLLICSWDRSEFHLVICSVHMELHASSMIPTQGAIRLWCFSSQWEGHVGLSLVGQSDADPILPLSEGSWTGWQQLADRLPLGAHFPISPSLCPTQILLQGHLTQFPTWEPFSNIPKRESHLAGLPPLQKEMVVTEEQQLQERASTKGLLQAKGLILSAQRWDLFNSILERRKLRVRKVESLPKVMYRVVGMELSPSVPSHCLPGFRSPPGL